MAKYLYPPPPSRSKYQNSVRQENPVDLVNITGPIWCIGDNKMGNIHNPYTKQQLDIGKK